jgi:hypothetical protein
MNLDQITLKGPTGGPASLWLRGDGELLRAALGPAGGRLWLPGGAAAIVTVEPNAELDACAEERGGEAAFTLRFPILGAIEVRMWLDAVGVHAAVTTPPGPMTERAAATLPDLVAGLEWATGRTGIASVQSRRGYQPGPTTPVRTMATPERVPDVVSPPRPAAAAVPVRIALDAPPELYQAVAEALVWAYRLTGAEPPA